MMTSYMSKAQGKFDLSVHHPFNVQSNCNLDKYACNITLRSGYFSHSSTKGILCCLKR